MTFDDLVMTDYGVVGRIGSIEDVDGVTYYTVYFDDENHTVFTTKEIKLTTKDNRDLILEVSKICPGRTMCPVSELKLIITLEARFAFLKGKDFFCASARPPISQALASLPLFVALFCISFHFS